jgi:AcrR family transcriptional regulator
MSDKKIDRRVRRTRRMFREAILELVMEKTFDDLTVTEITEHAGLRRATFYLHYTTKEDLLRSALCGIPTDPVKAYSADNVKIYHDVYRHVADHAALYRQLLGGSSAAIFQDHIRSYLLEHIHTPQGPLPDDMITQYVVGAFLFLVVWWLEASPEFTAAQMAQMTHHLVLEGIKGVSSSESQGV